MAPAPSLPDQVPAPPPGTRPTAWDPGSGAGDPRTAIVLLLNESYLRCRELGGLLAAQRAADRTRSQQAGAGLVGYKMARASDGTMYPTSEEPRALVTVELRERQFCASLAKMAHDLGITGDEW
jgi:hypothetical protein